MKAPEAYIKSLRPEDAQAAIDSRDNKNDQYTQGIEEENRACHERSFLIPRPVGEHQQKAPALLGERCIKNILNHALVI